MMKNIMLGFSLLMAVQVGAQTASPQGASGKLPNLNERFEGGTNKLRIYLGQTVTYPEEAVVQCRMGLSIAAVTITPAGQVQAVTIINSLGIPIDQEVTRVLQQTSHRWHRVSPANGDETFYVQLRFELTHHHFHAPSISGPNILGPVVISAEGPLPGPGGHILSDSKLKKRFHEAMEANDYALALQLLDEAIRRNPYNMATYPMRITCNRHLYQQKQARSDARKISQFMNKEPLAVLVARYNAK